MEVVKMETTEAPACVHCETAAVEAAKNDETGLALLLGILPVLTLTFFGQVGLL